MADRKAKAGATKRVAAPAAAPVQRKRQPKLEAPVELKALPKPAKVRAAAPTATVVEPVAQKVAEAVVTAPIEVAAAAVEPSREAAKTFENNANKGTRTMNQQINETIEKNREAGKLAADRFQAAFGDVNERAKTAMEKSARLMEEMTEISRGNVEAIVASSKVAARGVETLTQEAADFGRRSFEEASSTLKSFAEVKSPTDFFRLQSDFARAQFDAMVAESSKLSEAVIKLAGEVAEPITSRYSVAAERVKTIAL